MGVRARDERLMEGERERQNCVLELSKEKGSAENEIVRLTHEAALNLEKMKVRVLVLHFTYSTDRLTLQTEYKGEISQLRIELEGKVMRTSLFRKVRVKSEMSAPPR